MPPKVSVNICCYNGDKYLKETIKSVLSQTFTDLEVIIIDDGSTDATQKVINGFDDHRIKYFYQRNQGLSCSRNKALAYSSGQYIAIVDQDDVWEPEKIKRQADIFDLDSGVGLVYSDAYYINDAGKRLGKYFNKVIPQRGWVTKNLILGNFIPCPTVMIRTETLKKTGPFRVGLKLAEEYELFLRLSLISKFEFVNEPLAGYRVHANNNSKNITGMCQEEIVIMTNILNKQIGQELLFAAKKQLARKKIITAAYFLSGKGEEADRSVVRSQIALIESPIIRNAFYIMSFLPIIINRLIFRGANLLKDMLNMLRNRRTNKREVKP